MKKIYSLMAFAAIMTLAFSCNKETEDPFSGAGEETFSLVLDFGERATKADGDTPARNTTPAEDLVKTIDYLFYTDPASKPIYQGQVKSESGSIALSDYTYTLNLTAGSGNVPDINTLFPNGAKKIYFFAAVNTDKIEANTTKTLAQVKESAINTPFDAPFVMTGEKELTLTSTGVTDIVDLRRLASKMIFTINVANSVQVKTMAKDGYDEVWTPKLTGNNSRVYLCNAVYNTNLGAVTGNTDPEYVYPSELTQHDYPIENIKIDGDELSGETTTLVSKNTYYTYPLRWESGSDTEPFVKVVIPWRVVRTETVGTGEDAKTMVTYDGERELYYKVLLPEPVVKANCLYNFTINISVVGSEGEPQIVIVAKAQVLNWSGVDAIDSNISDVKYLKPEKEYIELYTNSSSVYFAHSEPVQINSVTMTHKDLRTGQTTTSDGSSFVSKPDDDHISLNHPLNNDLTSDDFDVSPYEFEVVLHLENDTGNRYDKTVKFVQYPALYIQDVKSNGKVFVNGQGYNSYILYGSATPVFNNNNSNGLPSKESTTNPGRYYVNSLTSGIGIIGNVVDPASITGKLNTTNDNWYQYIVKVSVLPDNSPNYIGDPRKGDVTQVSNLGYETFIWGDRHGNSGSRYFTPTLSVNSNVSSQYKPGADDSQHIIAPKFMIASSYGKTTNMTYEHAKERCAAYQENGYPAGRWRLPTVAEIDFLIKMSEKKRIPSLFDPEADAAYWAAGAYAYFGSASYVSGVYALDFSSTGDKTATTDDETATRNYHVDRLAEDNDGEYYFTYGNRQRSAQVWARCVYDIWYWGEDPVAEGTAAESWLGYKLQ